jgi:hypothetical protein
MGKEQFVECDSDIVDVGGGDGGGFEEGREKGEEAQKGRQ